MKRPSLNLNHKLNESNKNLNLPLHFQAGIYKNPFELYQRFYLKFGLNYSDEQIFFLFSIDELIQSFWIYSKILLFSRLHLYWHYKQYIRNK